MKTLKHFLLLIFIPATFFLPAQIDINGEVRYEGRKLSGAIVTSKKTPNGVNTNDRGQFTISIDSIGSEIRIYSRRYISKTIKIKKEKYVIVTLKKDKNFFELNGCCFTRGTKVLLSDGTEKNIECIKAGDHILNLNLNDFSPQQASVTQIDSIEHDNLVELELETKTRIKSTADHPYFIDGKGWCSVDPLSTYVNYGIMAQKLNVSDLCLIYTNGQVKKVAVRSIESIKGTFMTYNIGGLTANCNYFANGILVSNECDQRITTGK